MAEHKMKKLEDLCVDSLQDLYDAENQIIKAMPKMIEKAKSQELKQGLQQHLEVTNRQKDRLEQVFKDMKMSPQGKKCMGMQGLIKEGEEVMSEAGDDDVRDAAIIGSAQKIEHYEIAGYGTARAYARALGHKNVADVLSTTLDEESMTNEKLTKLAEGHINAQAKK
jgi:ferritin-like metal-binding protein YciE